MKKFSYILIAVATLMLPACSDFLDVKLHDQATLPEMFTQGGNAHRYLRQIYSFIPEDESISNREGWVVARSDEAQFSWTQWVYYLVFREGNYSSATTVGAAGFLTWEKYYQAISQCTIFINNIDLMKEYNNKGPEELAKIKMQMKAEAKFLRAYYYYCLVRQYGPVFIWMDAEGNPVTPDINPDASKIERNTMDECFSFILSQLDEAIEDLPVRVGDYGENQNEWMGRATKGAAMAVKCRVALMQASPLYNGQNGTGLYDNFVSKSNSKKFFSPYDATKWDKATEAHEALIALAESGEYALITEASTSTDPMQKAADNYQAIFQDPWNSETIWGWWKRESSEYNYLKSAGAVMCCAMPPGLEGYGGWSGITPSLKLVDAFPMQATGRYPLKLGNMYQTTDGRLDYSKPNVDPLSGYQAGNTGTAADWKEGYKVPVNADWAPAFKAHISTTGRDARFYQCIVPNGFPWPNSIKQKFFTCYNNSECSSKFNPSGDSNRAGYIWRKWYPTDKQLDKYQDYGMYVVYPSIRLAEIYLNYAECLIEKSTPDLATACVYINKIRNRAGLNNIEDAYPGIDSDKDLLREALRMERMVEFNGETLRHYDAIRWMIAPKEYTTKNWTLKCSATTYEESWTRVSDDLPLGDPTFTNRDYLFPIYSVHLAQMTNMTQNPGF